MVGLKRVSAILFVLLLASCSSTYEFGDLSKNYCQSTSPELRVIIKDQLNLVGVDIGVDFCTARGLADAMININ